MNIVIGFLNGNINYAKEGISYCDEVLKNKHNGYTKNRIELIIKIKENKKKQILSLKKAIKILENYEQN